MIDSSAKQLADQFFAALGAQLSPANVLESQTDDPLVPAAQQLTQTLRVTRSITPPPAAPQSETSRIVWFLMGVASTGFGVWLGAHLL
jgi:hypothetical protein